jgi:hypothetical protein
LSTFRCCFFFTFRIKSLSFSIKLIRLAIVLILADDDGLCGY